MADEQPQLAETLAEARQRFAEQVRAHFADDLASRGPADSGDRAAVVDALTSFESWDLLQGTHGRDRTGLRRAWIAGISALLAGD